MTFLRLHSKSCLKIHCPHPRLLKYFCGPRHFFLGGYLILASFPFIDVGPHGRTSHSRACASVSPLCGAGYGLLFLLLILLLTILPHILLPILLLLFQLNGFIRIIIPSLLVCNLGGC